MGIVGRKTATGDRVGDVLQAQFRHRLGLLSDRLAQSLAHMQFRLGVDGARLRSR
jgi:hypothetical protein